MKTFAEKMANLHQQLMTSWQELMRDVHKYNTEQQRKHKEVDFVYFHLSEPAEHKVALRLGYRGGSPTAVQAWRPCPLWEPSPSHPMLV